MLKQGALSRLVWMVGIEMHYSVRIQFHNSVECPYLGIVVLIDVHCLTASELSQSCALTQLSVCI